MKKLFSPYVIEVYKYNDEKNEYIMEHMDFTLEKYISTNNSSLNYQERKSICLQIIKAISYINYKNIFHRDISHTNILIKKFDDVVVAKISDFGLIKTPDSKLTSHNTELKGSFNDPDLLHDGFANYDIQHEVYALTWLLFYVMKGTKTIKKEKIQNENLKMFLDKGMNKTKNNRFKNVEELRKSFICIEEYN